MKKMDTATKVMALVGTVLVWLPLLAPVLLFLVMLNRGGVGLDWLIPAEMFPVVLLGGLLLLWAALRARSQRKLIAWGMGTGIGMLLGGQLLAVITGLADGRIAPQGWPFLLVTATMAIYGMAVLAVGVGGILLVRGMFFANRGAV